MKNLRIGINGAGRIGRLVIRLLADHPNIEIVCINDLMDIETLRYLLIHDSVHQKFNGTVEKVNSGLVINNMHVAYEQHESPSDIPWKKYEIDIVVESSGRFVTTKSLTPHFKAGAKKIILSCPAKDPEIKTVIVGINDHLLSYGDHIVSNASCTANGIAPMLQVMNDHFGIDTAFMTTVHPFTNNQRIMDAPHADPRRSRSLANNIIPTHSTAIEAIHSVFPFLKGRFEGVAIRVPIPAGALLELMVKTNKSVSVQSINDAFLDASIGHLRHILSFTDEEIVSTDIIGDPSSCVFDSKMTKVINDKYCYLAGWYDNEFGYANRVVNLIEIMGRMCEQS
jgi:glyceraldehyde 3-phosphate dehydrogenase